ncbi:DUF21 domain-containing protein [Gossypium australe]|uniref:DUF21 domain-containing protein n=1 Tax=Gossypium australe TaxID=47621 RepID=A0A5B6WH04_9ROSI|nr:DUF21 domain-containing protein [Gossypium australe]
MFHHGICSFATRTRQELHQFLQCIQMKCVEDAAMLKRFIEKEHIYEFLTGLNIEFDLVRVQILGNEDLLPLNAVISIIRNCHTRDNTEVIYVLQVLDWVLGHNEALFRRAQLKALVSIHSQEAGKGGELTHDETTIISGALDLTEKTAEEAMTPIESTFSLDVNSKLDWEAMGKILARGHSRVPVYSGNPKNIIGLLLVKSLLTVRPETETPVSAVSIRRIPRVPADMPLYDILNEFQKGSSHMAAVVKAKGKNKNLPPTVDGLKSEENKVSSADTQLTTPLLSKLDEKPESIVVDVDKLSRPTNTSRLDAVTNGLSVTSEDIEDGEVIGIITLEDVFEELLQEEIVDETDEYVDVHKRIRVAAAAAASSVARAPSSRRLTGQKGVGVQSKGQATKKPA